MAVATQHLDPDLARLVDDDLDYGRIFEPGAQGFKGIY
jgi:hypothetical protein